MIRLANPYGTLTGGRWLRGNLHTHSTRSDGSRSQQAVLDDYAGRGYGFLMFSDHDFYTSEADLQALESRGLILVPGNEISRGGPHLLHVDADRHIPSVVSRQEILNGISEAARETGRGFSIINHPDWQAQFDHATIEQLREWQGYLGMEIYNGVINRLDGSPYALGKWDMLLSEGRKIWGFANDDLHKAEGDIEHGWNVAYVTEPTRAGVVDALRSGRFYGSTGVVITSIEVKGARIRIVTENARRIAAMVNVGKRAAVVNSNEMEFECPSSAVYVRFQCWGDGEAMAWTQPFFAEPMTDETGQEISPFIPVWQVTSLAEGLTLDMATPEMAERDRVAVRTITSKEKGLLGFADARLQIRGQPGVVFLSASVESETERKGTLYMGYDGAVRVWLNRKLVFEGPGRNPAVVDRLAMTVALRTGANELLVALDTNGGKAWGLFGRID
jgi:hypothetical protein